MSKIYLVERTDDIGWDEYIAFVVVAKSPGEARTLCSQQAADEGAQIWLKDATTTEVVGNPRDPKSRIILDSFKAG